MADTPHHSKKRKVDKTGRNFRINGDSRGQFPQKADKTKYVRSGGPGRMAHRKAKLHGCGKPAEHLGRHGERGHK